MANEDTTQRTIPPYLAYRTFQNFIEGLRVGIPARIDRSVLPSLSGAVQSWLLGALRYLGLITPHGLAGDKLGKLVNAQGPERQKVLREILTEAYSFLFGDSLDLKTATPRQIEERFTEAGASGETVRKCIAFFVSMAKDAGLELSPYLVKARGRGSGQRLRRTATATPQSVNKAREEAEPGRATSENGWAQLLVSKFPTFDPAWPDEVKSKWFDAFDRLMKVGKEKAKEN